MKSTQRPRAADVLGLCRLGVEQAARMRQKQKHPVAGASIARLDSFTSLILPPQIRNRRAPSGMQHRHAIAGTRE